MQTDRHTDKNDKQPAAAPRTTSTCVKPADSENTTKMEEMIPRKEARRQRPRSSTTRCMREVHSDSIHDRNTECKELRRADPQRVKRAMPTAGYVEDTSWESQAHKTTRRRTHLDGAPGREQEQVPHSRSARRTSPCEDSAGAVLEQGCEPVVVRRQALMAQTVLGSPAVAVHRQERRVIRG